MEVGLAGQALGRGAVDTVRAEGRAAEHTRKCIWIEVVTWQTGETGGVTCLTPSSEQIGTALALVSNQHRRGQACAGSVDEIVVVGTGEAGAGGAVKAVGELGDAEDALGSVSRVGDVCRSVGEEAVGGVAGAVGGVGEDKVVGALGAGSV